MRVAWISVVGVSLLGSLAWLFYSQTGSADPDRTRSGRRADRDEEEGAAQAIGRLENEIKLLNRRVSATEDDEDEHTRDADRDGGEERDQPERVLSDEEQQVQADRLLDLYVQAFESEVRDAEWGSAEEERLTEVFGTSDFGNSVERVECRQQTCLVEISDAARPLEDIFQVTGTPHGAHARLKEDGTVVLLLGREGYEFEQIFLPEWSGEE